MAQMAEAQPLVHYQSSETGVGDSNRIEPVRSRSQRLPPAGRSLGEGSMAASHFFVVLDLERKGRERDSPSVVMIAEIEQTDQHPHPLGPCQLFASNSHFTMNT
eukprot:765127-Hanusia_phi.AAC.1